jgi:hypothetical protein
MSRHYDGTQRYGNVLLDITTALPVRWVSDGPAYAKCPCSEGHYTHGTFLQCLADNLPSLRVGVDFEVIDANGGRHLCTTTFSIALAP